MCVVFPNQPVVFSRVRVLLISHAETRAVGEHARGDVHGHELLEEKLGGVGDLDLGDASLVVAWTAFVGTLFDLSVGSQHLKIV